MDLNAIRKKFGGDYVANERTYIMGSDHRFTSHFAERFRGLDVLETFTGAGFATISLAKTAKHIYTVEIDQTHQEQAITNITTAGFLNQVSFIHGSILDQTLLNKLPFIDGAFIDPDWAVTGPDHVYCFINSNTRPPAVVKRLEPKKNDLISGSLTMSIWLPMLWASIVMISLNGMRFGGTWIVF
jgi:hypothetical protein